MQEPRAFACAPLALGLSWVFENFHCGQSPGLPWPRGTIGSDAMSKDGLKATDSAESDKRGVV